MSGTNGGSDPVILATAGYDHTIRFWQAHSGICHRTVQHPDSQVNDLEITPDRQMIAAAGYQHIRMYDLNSSDPNPVVNYDGITKNVTSVGFQEDGKWMYTGGEDNSAKIWDLRADYRTPRKYQLVHIVISTSRNLQYQNSFEVGSPVNSVCLHPNQAELVIGDRSGAIHIWDIKTNRSKRYVPEPDAAVHCVCIDPMAEYLAAVNNKGHCYIWALSKSADGAPTELVLKEKLPPFDTYALKCVFSPDSTLLATTSADHTVQIWNVADFSLLITLKDESWRWIWDCCFSSDSQYILTASSDSVARLWTVETGEVKREYTGHQKALTCLAFRDDIIE